MRIEIKCFATLNHFTPDNPDAYEVPDGATTEAVMRGLGMDPVDVKMIFVNGLHQDLDTVLEDGDRLGLFPAVGGG